MLDLKGYLSHLLSHLLSHIPGQHLRPSDLIGEFLRNNQQVLKQHVLTDCN